MQLKWNTEIGGKKYRDSCLITGAVKGKLPCLLKPVSSKKYREARHNNMKAKLKMKEYQDARSHAKPSPLRGRSLFIGITG